MSTVFYGFRASNNNNLSEQIGIAKYLVKEHFIPGEIQFQIFRTSIGIVYRVIEDGYGLKNKMWKHKDFFPTCNYDNRTDIPEEDMKNEVLCNEVDFMINRGQYSIRTIVKEHK